MSDSEPTKTDDRLDPATQRRVVRERHAQIATETGAEEGTRNSSDNAHIFREAFRVLRPGGRLAISDVVTTADVPKAIRADLDSVASRVAGAPTIARLREMLIDAGFEQIEISPKDDSDQFIREWDDEYDVRELLVSASVRGRKPE